MNQLINAALNDRWTTLQVGLTFLTPDTATGSPFSISSINSDSIEILTSGGTTITVTRRAFASSLDYLARNQHMANNPCPIGSNKDIAQAGPLCIAARDANGRNVMIINYLLPLLSAMDLVGINGNRPNKTWLL